MYEFIVELRKLMLKHNIKSITPLAWGMFIGFKDDDKETLHVTWGKFEKFDKN